MKVIDGQIHEPGLDSSWLECDVEVRRAAMTEVLKADLAAIGADGAVLHPVEDRGWAYELAAREPDRFVVVAMVDRGNTPGPAFNFDAINPDAPTFEATLAEELARPGVAALRLRTLEDDDLGSGEGYGAILEICERRGIPLVTGSTEKPDLWGRAAETFPRLTIIVDQMALRWRVVQNADWWREFPSVLALARFPNVNVKLTAVPAFSAAGFPFDDVSPYVRRLVDEFGSDRLLWASDISRYQGKMGCAYTPPGMDGDYPGRHTYAESYQFFRNANWLDDAEKENILGRTAVQLLWS